MNPLIAFLGGAFSLIILGYYLVHWVGKTILNRTVEFHTRNMDQELNDLLRPDQGL